MVRKIIRLPERQYELSIEDRIRPQEIKPAYRVGPDYFVYTPRTQPEDFDKRYIRR